MFTLMISDDFSAAHFLPGYKGDCSKIHGHNWNVEVFVKSENTIDGICIDFRELKSLLKTIIDELDHSIINNHQHFKIYAPTCENVSKYIFNRLMSSTLEGKLFGYLNYKSSSKDLYISSVRVWESNNSYAEYSLS